jgi:tetratricopeptide (TPR) repeat protein
MPDRRARPARVLLAVAGLSLALGACAPKAPPATAPAGAPRYPEFVFPTAAPAPSPAMLARHEKAWLALQAGDLRAAEREFGILLKANQTFHPAEAGLAYVALARKDYKNAIAHFDRALAIDAKYAPAHAGKGQALLASNQPDRALASFDAALAADPGLTAIRSTADVLRFKGLQGDVAAAREAAEAGRLAEARTAYQKAIAATPDSPFLYRELAMVERREGELQLALQHAQRALELEPTDARNHVVLADVLEAQGQYARAAEAVGAAMVLEPNEALARRAEALRERAALAALPAEFRAIEKATSITRADLAALIGVELEEVVKRAPPQAGGVMTDIRSSWAQPWILSVTRAGFMEPFANHAFQPNATVSRGDLAVVVSRVLTVIAASRPQLAAKWRNARPKFADLPGGHLRYPAVALAVAAGIMSPTAEGRFEPGRVVSGAEASSVVRRLEDLAGSTRR